MRRTPVWWSRLFFPWTFQIKQHYFIFLNIFVFLISEMENLIDYRKFFYLIFNPLPFFPKIFFDTPKFQQFLNFCVFIWILRWNILKKFSWLNVKLKERREWGMEFHLNRIIEVGLVMFFCGAKLTFFCWLKFSKSM